jgi:hypothetical protein
MTFEEQLEATLHSSQPPEELRSLVLRLHAEGFDQAAILERFENVRRQLREAGREKEEDAILDVMDLITGWCSPSMKLPWQKVHEKNGQGPESSGSS